MKNIWTGAVAAAGLILTSTASHAGDTPAAGAAVSLRDTQFVQSICDDSLMVQRIGELANQHSKNARVKELCQNLALDYGKARQQFCDMAKSIGVPITPELSARATHSIDRLRGMSGKSFDRATLRDLVTSEQAVLRKIQDEADRGDNQALKKVAASTLPQLQDDIYQVVTLESDLKTTAGAAIGASGRGLASEQ